MKGAEIEWSERLCYDAKGRLDLEFKPGSDHPAAGKLFLSAQE